MPNTASVKNSEIHVAGGTTRITSPALVDALVQDKADTVAGLHKLVAPFDASQMHVDQFGRVVVNDPNFTKVMTQRLAASSGGGPLADNGVCNGGACAKPGGISAASNPNPE